MKMSVRVNWGICEKSGSGYAERQLTTGGGATLQRQRQGSGERRPRAATLSTAIATSSLRKRSVSRHNSTGDALVRFVNSYENIWYWRCGQRDRSVGTRLEVREDVRWGRGGGGRAVCGAGSTAGAGAADDRQRLTCPAEALNMLDTHAPRYLPNI